MILRYEDATKANIRFAAARYFIDYCRHRNYYTLFENDETSMSMGKLHRWLRPADVAEVRRDELQRTEQAGTSI